MTRNFEITGSDELVAKLSELGDRGRAAGGRALFEAGNEIMNMSLEEVPVDKGILRSSGFVDRPETTASGVEVQLGYGGAANDYALVQHERLDFRHRVGKAKYLEDPANAWASKAEQSLGDALRRELDR